MTSVRSFEKPNKFHLVSSNRLENLAAALAGQLDAGRGKAVLSQETIIVQNRGMERYLRLRLAEIRGISANLEFPFPHKFISEQVFRPLLGGDKANPLEPGVLAWDIFNVLPKLVRKNPDFQPLRSYLAADPSGLKTFQLAQRIADLFGQYPIFRPDLVRKWSFGNNPLADHPHGRWQAELWREVVPFQNGLHFAELYRRFLHCAYPDIYGGSEPETPDFSSLKQAERIFLFGFSALAPVFLDLFLAVSRYIEVYCYHLNPCEAEWQYDLSDRVRLRLMVEKADFQPGFEAGEGNALLSSLGGLGREFFALLAASGEEPEPAFADCRAPDTLLRKIQRDLQLNESPATETVSPDDRSIQVHSCHTPMREVEVLFENLTAMFQADPTLRPGDVLVLTPDIDAYSPYIEAVFRSRAEDDPRRFFITVADRSRTGTLPEAEIFLNILKLARSRFKTPEVLSIWETPAVAAAFGLDEKQTAIVRQWIIDAHIAWGIDGEFRAETVGVKFSAQSWRQGIDRILAGFAFGGEAGESGRLIKVGGEDLLPFHCCEGESAVLFGKLVEFLEALFALRVQLNGGQEKAADAFSATWWERLLNRVIVRFFPDSGNFSRSAAILREAVKTITADAGQSDYRGEISYEIIFEELAGFFRDTAGGGGFLRGGITCCAARPLRSIPARVICLLGLDENSFPRREKHRSFDLMAAKPRLGDRSARSDDRYLFLEALLSARDCFYVSYVGQGVRDNEPRPPSAVLGELLDYIGEHYALTRENLITAHPLQAFSWKYFIDDRNKAAYGTELGIRIPDHLISYSTENRELAQLRFAEPSAPHFADAELHDIPEELYRIDLEDLGDFFANPAKYFLQQCLQVYPQVRDLPEPADCESFKIDPGLERYKLAEAIIKKYLPEWNKADRDELRKELRRRFHAEGLVPVGAWGDIEFDQFFEDFSPFAAKVAAKISQPLETVVKEYGFDNGVRLQAKFADLYLVDGQIKQIQFKFSKVNGHAGHLIRASLSELAAKAMEIVPEAGSLELIGREPSSRIFASRSAAAARKKISRLTDLYLEGLRRPLPFFPNASLAYASSGDLNAARKKWESSDYRRGEGEDAYINQCFGKMLAATPEFEQLAAEITELLELGKATDKTTGPGDE
ncbi:MAG: exodeoxyribonuclease V subunit gamma [Victivallaceae bacterium]|nr:exodeoxyribonuclease V subunit gamma [Victivallaceae bacterium]